MQHFEQSVYKLIVETSTNLPGDVRKVIQAAQEAEDRGNSRGVYPYQPLRLIFRWRRTMFRQSVRIQACRPSSFIHQSVQTKLL